MNKQRSLILIDGSNFYFKLKSLKIENLLTFDFTLFTQFIIRSKSKADVRYYVGKIKQDDTKKSQELFTNQQKLIAQLKKHQVRYVFGYLLNSKDTFHEKGVDVQIAVDMLESAYENTYDRIILVSSDTDLAPAIRKARQRGKVVEYIGFSHQPSVAMVRFCSESRLLTKEDIQQFVKK